MLKYEIKLWFRSNRIVNKDPGVKDTPASILQYQTQKVIHLFKLNKVGDAFRCFFHWKMSGIKKKFYFGQKSIFPPFERKLKMIDANQTGKVFSKKIPFLWPFKEPSNM